MEELKRSKCVKVDFRKIPVKNIEGEVQYLDISNILGNKMYMQGANITECELGREIYKAGKVDMDKESFVEMTEEQVAIVMSFIKDMSYLARTSIENSMKSQQVEKAE